MNIIKDKALAKSGHDKINWVKSYMPVLNSIEAEFERIKPFAGQKNRDVDSFGSKNGVSCHGIACGGRRGTFHRLQSAFHAG